MGACSMKETCSSVLEEGIMLEDVVSMSQRAKQFDESSNDSVLRR